MPVPPGHGVTIQAGISFYRITSRTFWTKSAKHHKKVVNGDGAVHSRHGARYNHPGATTVYLAEDVPTCLAEKMFYFHREVLVGIDSLHLLPGMALPPFQQTFALWDIVFTAPVNNVFDLSVANATAAGVFPCLLLNPSQDYHHLKDRRAGIQHSGYNGLRAPSTRSVHGGRMVVLFDDQSGNVASITPYAAEFRLVTPPGAPFANHAVDQLDFRAGEVRISAAGHAPLPAAFAPFATWQRMPFNH